MYTKHPSFLYLVSKNYFLRLVTETRHTNKKAEVQSDTVWWRQSRENKTNWVGSKIYITVPILLMSLRKLNYLESQAETSSITICWLDSASFSNSDNVIVTNLIIRNEVVSEIKRKLKNSDSSYSDFIKLMTSLGLWFFFNFQ